jgi:hypothetical protein
MKDCCKKWSDLDNTAKEVCLNLGTEGEEHFVSNQRFKDCPECASPLNEEICQFKVLCKDCGYFIERLIECERHLIKPTPPQTELPDTRDNMPCITQEELTRNQKTILRYLKRPKGERLEALTKSVPFETIQEVFRNVSRKEIIDKVNELISEVNKLKGYD